MSLSMPAASSIDIDYRETAPSDEVLVSMAKSGDADAFVELSKRHAGKVFQATYRITRNRQDAEDALQDSFLKAFIHIQNFEQRSSFSTWLTRIAINSALMSLRKKRGCYEIPIDHPSQHDGNIPQWEFESPTEDPESHYVRREREKLLREAILQLPPVFRDVIELRGEKECSAREIAKALGISVAAVKSRLSRAKNVLRTSLLQAGSPSESC
jgi:RNA polymerase sigma-70 factor, ECF subfamily